MRANGVLKEGRVIPSKEKIYIPKLWYDMESHGHLSVVFFREFHRGWNKDRVAGCGWRGRKPKSFRIRRPWETQTSLLRAGMWSYRRIVREERHELGGVRKRSREMGYESWCRQEIKMASSRAVGNWNGEKLKDFRDLGSWTPFPCWITQHEWLHIYTAFHTSAL